MYTKLQAEPSGGYLVELRTKEDRQWRPAPREVIAETESQSVVLESLTPNTLYQVITHHHKERIILVTSKPHTISYTTPNWKSSTEICHTNIGTQIVLELLLLAYTTTVRFRAVRPIFDYFIMKNYTADFY